MNVSTELLAALQAKQVRSNKSQCLVFCNDDTEAMQPCIHAVFAWGIPQNHHVYQSRQPPRIRSSVQASSYMHVPCPAVILCLLAYVFYPHDSCAAHIAPSLQFQWTAPAHVSSLLSMDIKSQLTHKPAISTHTSASFAMCSAGASSMLACFDSKIRASMPRHVHHSDAKRHITSHEWIPTPDQRHSGMGTLAASWLPTCKCMQRPCVTYVTHATPICNPHVQRPCATTCAGACAQHVHHGSCGPW